MKFILDRKTKHFLSIAILLILASCDNMDFSNPEEVIRNYQTLSNKDKYGVLYDNYLSTKSKEFVTKDEYIKKMTISDSTLIVTEYLETTITPFPVDINAPTFRRFKIEEKNVVKTDTIDSRRYYSLLNEDGKWKVIWTETLYSFAKEKYEKGNYAEAKKTIEKIIEINPFDGMAYSLLSWCYSRDMTLTKKVRETGTAENAKHAIALEEEKVEHYNTLGNYYMNIENRDLAIQTFERGLKYCQSKKAKTGLYSNIANMYISIRKYAKAEEYLKKSIEIDDNYAFTWMQYGLLMFDQNKITKAIEYCEKALKAPKMENKLQGCLYAFYAGCCFNKKKCDIANEYINKALDIEPDNSFYQTMFQQIKQCKK
jgi:tetratricopeptide (TPR) repeat protein